MESSERLGAEGRAPLCEHCNHELPVPALARRRGASRTGSLETGCPEQAPQPLPRLSPTRWPAGRTRSRPGAALAMAGQRWAAHSSWASYSGSRAGTGPGRWAVVSYLSRVAAEPCREGGSVPGGLSFRKWSCANKGGKVLTRRRGAEARCLGRSGGAAVGHREGWAALGGL